MDSSNYLKTDENKLIHERCIQWAQKMNECFEVCTKLSGCSIKHGDTYRICKANSPESYKKLAAMFP